MPKYWGHFSFLAALLFSFPAWSQDGNSFVEGMGPGLQREFSAWVVTGIAGGMTRNADNAILPDARTNFGLDKTSNALLTGGGAGAAYNAVPITGLVLGNGTSAPSAYGGSGTCPASQWFTALSSSGGKTCTQPAFGDISGTLLATQFPALTGDVTTPGGSLATTIAANSVTNAKAAQMANGTVKCRTTAGTGNAEDCATVPVAALPALTGDVTRSAGSAATVLAAGSAGNLNSGTLLAARMPALTGDCTTSSGAVATACKATSKVVNTSYDLATASGNQAITGFGFRPSACDGMGAVGGTPNVYATLLSHSDSALGVAAIYYASANITLSTALFFVAADATSANYQLATLASYDADGITLSWAKTGSPVGSFVQSIRCFK